VPLGHSLHLPLGGLVAGVLGLGPGVLALVEILELVEHGLNLLGLALLGALEAHLRPLELVD